jgi:DNA-3-methyladenine glycosylase
MERRLSSKLTEEFYLRHDVVGIARDLLGKVLCTCKDGHLTAGIIVETEAYAGVSDKASHAWQGRRSKRNEVMYEQGGRAYVYLCYGIHNLFNVVTHTADVPHAVLIRGIHPVWGLELMAKRRQRPGSEKGFGIGPGKVSQALGIQLSDNGSDLSGNEIWISDPGLNVPATEIIASERIGISYAAEDALLPYRFSLQPETERRLASALAG